MNYLALDIGSSSIKGTVWDLDRLAMTASIIRIPCPEPITDLPARHFELDPLAIADATGQVIEALVEQVGEIAGIVSCNQMAGVVLTDTKGNPLSNYLSWRDQRVLEPFRQSDQTYYEAIQERLTPARSAQLGHECKLGSAASLLFWLNENNRLTTNTTPLMLGDFIAMHLAGAPPHTEFTNALGALHLETGDWHHDAFDALELPKLEWPSLCDSYGPVGNITMAGKSIPWHPSVGDHQCALAGTLLQPNELSINASTGSQVSLLSSEYAAGDYQVRPYFDQQYLNTLTHLPAGRSLNVLVDLLGELARSQGITLSDPWPYILQAAGEANLDLKANLTFFAGPLGERGSIENISVDNLTIGSLFQSAFTNMADNYQICADRLAPEQPWQTLVLSGGLIQRSELLRELITARLPGPQRLCPTEEETLTGLLAIALVASGRAEDLSVATKIVADSQV